MDQPLLLYSFGILKFNGALWSLCSINVHFVPDEHLSKRALPSRLFDSVGKGHCDGTI